MRLFADNIPGPIAYLDRSLKYTFVNQAFANSVCKPQDEIYGKTPFEVMASDVASFLRPIAQARARRRARRIRAHRHDAAGPAPLDARPHRARPRRRPARCAACIAPNTTSTTSSSPSRRWPRARSSCASSPTTFRSRSSTSTTNLRYVFVNEAFLRLTGLDRDNVIGKHVGGSASAPATTRRWSPFVQRAVAGRGGDLRADASSTRSAARAGCAARMRARRRSSTAR